MQWERLTDQCTWQTDRPPGYTEHWTDVTNGSACLLFINPCNSSSGWLWFILSSWQRFAALSGHNLFRSTQLNLCILLLGLYLCYCLRFRFIRAFRPWLIRQPANLVGRSLHVEAGSKKRFKSERHALRWQTCRASFWAFSC